MQSFFDGLISIGNDILSWASGIASSITSALSFSGKSPAAGVKRSGSEPAPAPAVDPKDPYGVGPIEDLTRRAVGGPECAAGVAKLGSLCRFAVALPS